jgi:hypothetical protein
MLSLIQAVSLSSQRGPTGGPRATSVPKTLLTRTEKLFVNLLLVATNTFNVCSPNNLKTKMSRVLSRLLLYVQVPHKLLTLNPCRKINGF